MSATLYGERLIDKCTVSIAYDKQVQSACFAFEPQMIEIITDTDQVVMIPNIMNIQDENLIDILAWQFHVDFYDRSRPLEFRRKLVQMSIRWHKTKGTRALVQEVLDTYWPGAATLQEWFEYRYPLPPGQPDPNWHDRYRFRIFLDQGLIPDAATQDQVLQLIDRFKPVSRWLEAIVHPKDVHGDLWVCAVVWWRVTRNIGAA